MPLGNRATRGYLTPHYLARFTLPPPVDLLMEMVHDAMQEENGHMVSDKEAGQLTAELRKRGIELGRGIEGSAM